LIRNLARLATGNYFVELRKDSTELAVDAVSMMEEVEIGFGDTSC
jgi:hypothetical protein